MRTPWPRIITLWLVGILAAAQLAKISAIAPILRESFHLSLPEIALLISLLEVGGALFGFVAGLGLARFGMRAFLLLGGATLAGTSLVEAIAPSPAILFAARAVEGIGYLLMVIVAPTAIAALATERSRGRALALWSTFVPVGLALGSAVTASLVTLAGPRGVMLVWAVALAAITALLTRFPLPGASGRRITLPAPAAWISTFAFGLYTLFVCALLMLLPSFLVERSGAPIEQVGLVTALASLAALPGSAAAMWLMRGGALGRGRMMLVSILALLATLPLVFWLYQGTGASLAESGAIAIGATLISGLVPPLMFARLPAQSGATTPDDPRIAAANGLITQFGAGGALLGPPLAGMVVAAWGWPALGIALIALVLAMLACLLAAESL
ncbi:MFS transporter [Sphingomonas sp. CBMAI 2297]|uniref:MFS transporter n=1 Tax=Sphingomonas sp. CBMAI 2297 TaxID=2991720 RepID=UPI0024582962|nr:MFS transporter [Sphingomonas sp. CBMAI 2297]MDH4743289.1 MFS transporter [Sphingomonas sp. CBMAI 2297]